MKKYWMDVSVIYTKSKVEVEYPRGVKIFGDTKKSVRSEFKKCKEIIDRISSGTMTMIEGRIYEYKEISYDANNAV